MTSDGSTILRAAQAVFVGIFFIVSAAVILNLYLCCTANPAGVSDERYRAFYDELDGVSGSEKTAIINAKIDELYNGEFAFETINQRDLLYGSALAVGAMRFLCFVQAIRNAQWRSDNSVDSGNSDLSRG